MQFCSLFVIVLVLLLVIEFAARPQSSMITSTSTITKEKAVVILSCLATFPARERRSVSPICPPGPAERDLISE